MTIKIVFAATAFSLAVATAPVSVCAEAQPVPAAADTRETTDAGAAFVLPKAWSLQKQGQTLVALAPEGDLRVVVADVGQAGDAAGALAKAWAAWRPDLKRTPKLINSLPPRDGWDERASAEYETSPNEKAEVYAVALRKDQAWTVAIVDGSQATSEKRLAAVRLMTQTLRPRGYSRESFAGRAAHPLDPARVEQMKAFVQDAMAELGVPGAGFALIDHGRIVYEGGLGVRELGRPEPVDAHTLFMVASNTKGMSTLLLSELADEGKLGWDEKVTNVYPGFRLGSAATTEKVLIKHLVCACTGLPRKDFDWIFNTRRDTPATVTFDQLAATEPTSRFGEVFQYNNLMASAAGYIGGHLVHPDLELGQAYDKAMQEKVFDPLQMRDTTFDYARAIAGDHASPHAYDVDAKPSLVAMDFNYSVRPYRPAGGAWSSAHDMILYAEDEITRGVLPDGHRLVSEQNLLERRKPNVPIGEDAWYGMGLETDATWGVKVIHHGGSMSGFKSDWMIVPDAQVGAVILTNSDEGQLMLRPTMRRLLEVLYDGKPEAAADVTAAARRLKAEYLKERPRLAIPPNPEAVAALASHYTSPELGPLTVTRSPDGVVFGFASWSTHVASRRNDDGTTSFISIDPGDFGEFVVGPANGKRSLIVRDGQHEYGFTED